MKGEIAIQSDNVVKEQTKINYLLVEKQRLQSQGKELHKKLDISEKLTSEKDDEIADINCIIDNMNLEQNIIKKELVDQKCDACNSSCSKIFKCDQCDFTSESQKGIKIHMGRMHEIKCDTCSEKFHGESKLKSHMCRIHVSNPTCNHLLYMKNWYVKNEYIRVFCNKKKKQVAILHSDYSEEFEECQEALQNVKHEVTVKDKDNVLFFIQEIKCIDTSKCTIIPCFPKQLNHRLLQHALFLSFVVPVIAS